MNKLCVIGVYFGNLPNYFSLFLKSCQFNKTIDFYFFTDSVESKEMGNIFFVNMKLEEVRARASEVLGFDAVLSRPYKCCDYKILYGEIFKDYVGKYDYWGHCDFDLIFGDLQSFFDQYQLYDYDRFLTRGHLAMYKNTKENNRRYLLGMEQERYQDVFRSDNSFYFDEDPMTDVYINHNFPIFTKLIFADISLFFKRFKLIEKPCYDTPYPNYDQQVFYWENGKVFRTYVDSDHQFREQEFIYIHFQKRPNFSVTFDVESCNSFYVTSKGFFPKNGTVTLGDIKIYNRFYGENHEKRELQRRKNKDKRRLRKQKIRRFVNDKLEIAGIYLKRIFKKGKKN